MKLMCADAKQLDLVDYLASLGHQPQKARNQDHWYLSPLQEEKTPSFKVDRRLNMWYDRGTGKGGDLIDFGTLYYRCTVSDCCAGCRTTAPDKPFLFNRLPPFQLLLLPRVLLLVKKKIPPKAKS